MRTMKQWAQKQTGFTIVELLIVVVVIAILAAISIVSYNGITERARVSQANSELRTLEKAILTARINNNSTLMGVTGSNCTSCFDQARYELTLDRIGAAAGVNLDSLKDGDPWGDNYYIDENEGEGADPCSNRDGFTIVDRATKGAIYIAIPFFTCS